jgi:hypothetical protein
MKKTRRTKKRAVKKEGVNPIVYGIIALALLGMFGFGSTARGQFSLLDRVAEIAGRILGEKLALEVNVGELSESEFVPSFGAFPGPELGPTVSQRGFEKTAQLVRNDQLASSTVCSIRPPNGSSTLSAFLFQAVATSTTYDVELYEDSITGGATGTRISKFSIAAGVTPRLQLYGPQYSTSTLPNHLSGVILSNSGSTTNAAQISFATDDDVLKVRVVGNAVAGSAEWKLNNVRCGAEFIGF